MIKDCLYAEYLLERRGIFSLLKENSFVAYKVSEKECFIVDLYIQKQMRGTGYIGDLIKEISEIADSRDCNVLTGNIHLSDKSANRTLRAALKLGFNVSGCNNNVLLISKNIKEDS